MRLIYRPFPRLRNEKRHVTQTRTTINCTVANNGTRADVSLSHAARFMSILTSSTATDGLNELIYNIELITPTLLFSLPATVFFLRVSGVHVYAGRSGVSDRSVLLC